MMLLDEQFISRLRHQVENHLPGEQSHVPMAPLSRPLSSLALKETNEYRRSAVSVVLTNIEKKSSLILIQRPDYEGAHSGQISFPGGKMDKSDPSSEHTARRECYEEIGLQLHHSALIGKLTDVYIPVSNFLVHPYLYIQESPTQYFPDDREVTEIISFPLFDLVSDVSISTMNISAQQGVILKEVPCFQFGQKKIGGATALIMNELRDLLLQIL